MQLPPGPMTVDKRDFVNSLSALYTAHIAIEDGMRDDALATGYRQGFMDALLAVAAAAGVVEDFSAKAGAISQLRYRSWRSVLSKG